MAGLNDAQATEAIKETEGHHKNAACALQQAHQDNVLVLDHEAKVTKPLGGHVSLSAQVLWGTPQALTDPDQ